MAAIKDGDAVEVRASDGAWHRTTARSGPRYDYENAFGRSTFLSIAVDWPSGADCWVNWPAEDVRPAGEAL